jgi:uncharacterized protein YndB with AHSA1/START domain
MAGRTIRAESGVHMSARSDRRADTASRTIAASTNAIYDAFRDPAVLMQWLPPVGMSGRVLEYDFRVGGRYRIELRFDDTAASGVGKTTDRTDVTTGCFRALQPGRCIAQSVEFESRDPDFAGEMTMTWSFEPIPSGTMVTVTATGVPSGITKADHDAGLRSSLDHLAAWVETGRRLERR